MAGEVGAGAANGAASGAAAGTMIMPGLGTAIGALAGGLLGAGSGILSNKADKKATKQAREDRLRAMAMLDQALQNNKYQDLYGGYADVNGFTTGNITQDAMLRALAQQVQAKELQALAINNARQNLTDREYQAQQLAQALREMRTNNSTALSQASRVGRRTGMDMSNMLLANANQQARQRNALMNAAMSAQNNNLQRIGHGTNLNTGSIADTNRQRTQLGYANALQNQMNVAQQKAGLMGNMPVGNGYSNLGAALQAGMTGALSGGLAGYNMEAGAYNKDQNMKER